MLLLSLFSPANISSWSIRDRNPGTALSARSTSSFSHAGTVVHYTRHAVELHVICETGTHCTFHLRPQMVELCRRRFIIAAAGLLGTVQLNIAEEAYAMRAMSEIYCSGTGEEWKRCLMSDEYIDLMSVGKLVMRTEPNYFDFCISCFCAFLLLRFH